MERKGASQPRGRSNHKGDRRTKGYDAASESGATAQPHFDVTKVEGFVPIEQFKNGWTWPDYDPDNPEHERMALFLARVLVKVQERRAAGERTRADAEAIAVEPKFVSVRRRRRRARH